MYIKHHKIDRNRNWPFNLIQNKVGYRSCFATGVKLEKFLWNSFDEKNEKKPVRKGNIIKCP
jgi:hypothetical protein